MGRLSDARPHIVRAVELNPLWPINHGELALHYWETGQTDSALHAINRSLELDSTFSQGYWGLGFYEALNGNFEAAYDVLEHVAGNTLIDGSRAWVYLMGGDTARGIALTDSMKQWPKKDHVAIARIHAALGEDTEAFEWLERGMEYRDPMMIWLSRPTDDTDPLLRLRPDPRFQVLLRRLDFPDIEGR
jgi:tetratricopeptide (TPR) repeat protein